MRYCSCHPRTAWVQHMRSVPYQPNSSSLLEQMFYGDTALRDVSLERMIYWAIMNRVFNNEQKVQEQKMC